MQASLKCIVPNAFGIHTDCSESWCRWKQEPAMYKHAYLPYGKDLHGEELKLTLNDIFSQYHSDNMVEKLAPIANSRRNESFNSTVGSKNPKIRFYGGSESNDFRVACAVAQTNVGHGYICRTLSSLGIEPGTNCEAYVNGMKRKRDGDNNRKKSLKFKKRRNEIHTKQIHGILSTDTLASYEVFVPPYTPRPQCSPIAFDDNAAVFYNIVLFDTETNTTGKQAELCQLAAINQTTLASFSQYVLPNKNIDKYASRVNNLSIKTVDGKRVLSKQSNPVLALTCDEVLSRFIHYLKNSIRECQKLTAHKVCTVLVGHNAKRFDVPVILHNSNSNIIAKFQSLGIFFGDSLSLFEYLVKESILKDRNGDSCALNQSAVYKALFDQGFDAHDALENVKALHRILFSSPLNLSEKDLITHCQAIPFDEAYQDNLYLDQRHQLAQTFNTKLHGTISKGMVEKIASSGLSFANLQSLFDKFGRNGLIGVLSNPPTNNRGSKKPRVTKSKRILLAIVQYFEQTASEQ
ncbi:exonuclease R569 [Paramuricea clavata]|uniref:Exonuclease R569 n=1 Tax=Paramuricea clavata TaxID=317549 RepID=A0A6S7HBF7_PARCT|nr:exonuclease R569 [Paramuricea clavata]